jgi:hypothetical protein
MCARKWLVVCIPADVCSSPTFRSNKRWGAYTWHDPFKWSVFSLHFGHHPPALLLLFYFDERAAVPLCSSYIVPPQHKICNVWVLHTDWITNDWKMNILDSKRFQNKNLGIHRVNNWGHQKTFEVIQKFSKSENLEGTSRTLNGFNKRF